VGKNNLQFFFPGIGNSQYFFSVTAEWRGDQSSHNGKIYYISGPESLSCDDLANIFTAELDMEVRNLYTPIEQIAALIQSTSNDRPQIKDVSSTSPATLMIKVRHKMLAADFEAKEMCEQYSLILQELEKFELHGLVSTLTEDILGRPCRTFRDYVADKLEHFRENIIIYCPLALVPNRSALFY